MERCDLCAETRPVYIERTMPGGVVVLCDSCKDRWQANRRIQLLRQRRVLTHPYTFHI